MAVARVKPSQTACLARPWPAGLCVYEAFTVSRRWMAGAPTLTVCDLLIMIMGQLASFELP